MSQIAVCELTPDWCDKARGNAAAISVMGHTAQPDVGLVMFMSTICTAREWYSLPLPLSG